ncbi:hypothetical protein FIBSPDRAFT_426718 [Athelia psychrophila]|uniref:Uncharacterized protein n=1 Tax=Athelia psychrophila TaxID=1759441 RepID=A0A166MS19_9AGAM|nr:hypothetical protein FIBSPDRAFT_426718 [Fibularhizoctonia sp. CBS 109695]
MSHLGCADPSNLFDCAVCIPPCRINRSNRPLQDAVAALQQGQSTHPRAYLVRTVRQWLSECMYVEFNTLYLVAEWVCNNPAPALQICGAQTCLYAMQLKQCLSQFLGYCRSPDSERKWESQEKAATRATRLQRSAHVVRYILSSLFCKRPPLFGPRRLYSPDT